MSDESARTFRTFGEYIREKRLEKRMTIRQVALYSGVSKSYISLLERGKTPKPSMVKKLSKPLGVPYEVLMKVAGHNEIVPPIDDDHEHTIPVIRLLRESLGYSVDQFAERVGLGVEEITLLENHQVCSVTLRMVFEQLKPFVRGVNELPRQVVVRLPNVEVQGGYDYIPYWLFKENVGIDVVGGSDLFISELASTEIPNVFEESKISGYNIPVVGFPAQEVAIDAERLSFIEFVSKHWRWTSKGDGTV